MGLQRSTSQDIPRLYGGGGGQKKKQVYFNEAKIWLYTLGSFCVLSHKLAILTHWNKIIY